jgi:hypothetical protein
MPTAGQWRMIGSQESRAAGPMGECLCRQIDATQLSAIKKVKYSGLKMI